MYMDGVLLAASTAKGSDSSHEVCAWCIVTRINSLILRTAAVSFSSRQCAWAGPGLCWMLRLEKKSSESASMRLVSWSVMTCSGNVAFWANTCKNAAWISSFDFDLALTVVTKREKLSMKV